jgi:hypothetical protein
MTYRATRREPHPGLAPSKAGRRSFWQRFVNVTFIPQAEEDTRLAELERLARQPRERKRSVSSART